MITAYKKLLIDGIQTEICFQITLRKRKSIGIKLLNANTVALHWPNNYPTKNWEQAISSKEPWIILQLGKVKAREAHVKSQQLADSAGVWVLGHPVHVPLPEHWDESAKALVIQSLFWAVGEVYLNKRFEINCQQVPQITQGKVPTLRFSQATTRWGSCSSKGHIMLNRRLYAAPDWVIDYVILHELCHLVFMSHKADFWHLLSSVCPQVHQAKQWLKLNQGILLSISTQKTKRQHA